MQLSFIVPVYNVAPYLRKCVDSLIHQDFSDYEIVLIDDGSTDESGKICDEYLNGKWEMSNAKSVPIRVIHQPNAGLSAARNAGVKCAEGKYICFVDSDDYWEPNVLGGLMAQVEREQLDVLRFDYQNVRLRVESGKLKVNREYEVFEPYKRSHRIDNDYSEKPTDGVTFLNTRYGTACYAVMFILRRDLIVDSRESRVEGQECLFTEGIYFEDTNWTPRMLVRAKRVASTDTIVYNYLVRQGSITKAVEQSKKQKVLDDKMRLIGEMQRQAKELQPQGLNNVWFSRMIADTVISVIGILSTQFYDERKIYLEHLRELQIYPIYSGSLKARLINISPRLAVELLHWKNGRV